MNAPALNTFTAQMMVFFATFINKMDMVDDASLGGGPR
jgi:hypothetical protein